MLNFAWYVLPCVFYSFATILTRKRELVALLLLFFLCLVTVKHGWASAELPRNRVNINLFLRHIWDLSR